MKSDFYYKENKTKEISFPLGGIGSGCIGLAGNGCLIDWEIFNKPNKGGLNGFSHFAVKAESARGVLDCRILHGDLQPPYTGTLSQSAPFKPGFGPPVPGANQFGFGPPKSFLAGFPHFEELVFEGKFPIARLRFSDRQFPGKIVMTAFNPLIPLNDRDSSIPAAFFELEIENDGEEEIEYTLALTLRNPFPSGATVHKFTKQDNISRLQLASDKYDEGDTEFGDLTAATDARDVSYQQYWYRGTWNDNMYMYWNDLNAPGRFHNRTYSGDTQQGVTYKKNDDHCLLAAHVKVKPGAKDKARFVISWNFPNCSNYWNPVCNSAECQTSTWKNYYATLFKDSTASASYSLKSWERLYDQTNRFKDAVFSSTLPPHVIDAISANISILKTPTVMRLEDGTVYGWEGCQPTAGCCEGSCTHVWNYAYALPFLFPNLERSMRDANFKYNVETGGHMSYRLQLPLGREPWRFHACVDGQFGEVIKAYRDWKISGDSSWLQSHWKTIRSCIEYAWDATNPDKWDPEKTGVLHGRQHNTLDMELFGPNAWLTGYYLVALKAASEMAVHLSDTEAAEEYQRLFEKGKQWTDKHLFNGEYYFQDIDLKDRGILSDFLKENALVGSTAETYWNEEQGELKYQIAGGCEVNQVGAQWHANIIGIGEIFDSAKMLTALKSIYRYNFKKPLRNVFNPCRVFGLDDEAGTIVCEYLGDKPVIPVPYAEETWNGLEYMIAAQMIQEGLVEQGLEITKAARERFDGEKRNPWNEFECGSNYARSMSSYTLLLALSGFSFDMVRGHIGFSPQIARDNFVCFWCVGGGWGVFRMNSGALELTVTAGQVVLSRFYSDLLAHKKTQTVTVGSEAISFRQETGYIEFEKSVSVSANEALTINLS